MALDKTFAHDEYEVLRSMVATINSGVLCHGYQFVALLGGEVVEAGTMHEPAHGGACAAAPGFFGSDKARFKFAHRIA